MTKQGIFLSEAQKRKIFSCLLEKMDVKQIHNDVFDGNEGNYTLKSLQNYIRNLEKLPYNEQKDLSSRKSTHKGGRKRKLGPAHDEKIVQSYRKRASMHLEDIKDELMRDFQDEFDSVPSTSTIWRHVKELGHKRHRINRRHVREDPNEIQQYLNSVAFLETRQFVDLDGIHFNPKDYEEKWGYSLIGEEAFVFQIVIRNKTYAVHAALCEDGFLTYAIFDRNVTSEDVAAFIRDKVAPLFPPDAFLILDNAANQNHPTVHEALRLHLGGKYFFSPRYSPRHKPIERAFSMVRKWIRSNEYRYENVEDPKEIVIDAFDLYSVTGSEGINCRNLFSKYKSLHEGWLVDPM